MAGRIALADDLSGAAEAATLLAGVDPAGHLLAPAVITSFDHLPDLTGPSGVLAVDLDTRQRTSEERRSRIRATASAVSDAGERVLLCKIDSLLRGGVGDIVSGLLDAGLAPVLAPALPALGRATSQGSVVIDGSPLSRTSLLDDESGDARGDARRAISPLRSTIVGLDVVRGAEARLRSAVLAAVAQGTVPLVDASTDDDLDRLVRATADLPRLVLTGAGGLAAALGRSAGPAPADSASPRGQGAEAASDQLLVVVGSRSAAAGAQLAALARSGWQVVDLPKRLLLQAAAAGSVEGIDHPALDSALAALAAGRAAISIGYDDAVSSRSAHLLADGLGIVSAALGTGAALVLTGGETARAVLTHLEIHRVEAARVIEVGCVLSHAEDGRPIITRPGSFGGPDNLIRLAQALTRRIPAGTASPAGKAEP